MTAAIQHRHVVTWIFYAASAVLGIPSAIAFVFFAWGLIQMHYLDPGPISPSSPTGNQLIDGLVAGGSIIGKAFAFAGGAMSWAMTIFTIGASIILVIAAVLLLIARGLNAGRQWARVLGIVITLIPLCGSLITLTSFQKPVPIVLGTILMAASAYIIFALGWRFA